MPHFPTVLKAAACALVVSSLWLGPVLAQDNSPDLFGQQYQQGQGQQGMEAPQGMTVPFNHNEHNKKAKLAKCATCHHALPGIKPAPAKKGGQPRNPTERKCSDCHKPRPGANDFAVSLMVASHKLCQDCHKAQNKGPQNCSGCHKNGASAQ
jgi:predicted CXXCH cytochrome family protein